MLQDGVSILRTDKFKWNRSRPGMSDAEASGLLKGHNINVVCWKGEKYRTTADNKLDENKTRIYDKDGNDVTRNYDLKSGVIYGKLYVYNEFDPIPDLPEWCL